MVKKEYLLKTKHNHVLNGGNFVLEINNTITIIGCVIGIAMLGLIFKVSILKIIKLIFNSILGGTLIFFINQLGISFGIHIGLNVITSIVIGIFGIPGAMLLLAVKIF